MTKSDMGCALMDLTKEKININPKGPRKIATRWSSPKADFVIECVLVTLWEGKRGSGFV